MTTSTMSTAHTHTFTKAHSNMQGITHFFYFQQKVKNRGTVIYVDSPLFVENYS